MAPNIQKWLHTRTANIAKAGRTVNVAKGNAERKLREMGNTISKTVRPKQDTLYGKRTTFKQGAAEMKKFLKENKVQPFALKAITEKKKR